MFNAARLTGLMSVAIAAAVATAGCGPTGARWRVPQAADGDLAEWTAAASRVEMLHPAAGNWSRRGLLDTEPDGAVAALLFDLKSLPEGAAVSRAVLRLRRGEASGGGEPAAIDVRKGLRVLYYSDGEPIFGITRARVTTDKSEMLAEGSNETAGARACGLALAGYPVECSLPSEKYTVGMFRAGRRYGELLAEWNGIIDEPRRRAAAWDELDVTGAVCRALAADGKVLLALTANGGRIAWLGGREKSERWAEPQLIVEYEPGQAPATPPAPVPEPPPVTLPEPPAQSEPTESAAPAPSDPAASAGTGVLVITSEPSRADIWIDGKYVGTTPSRELTLPAGEVKVRIGKVGFRPWERTVTVLKDNVVSVGPELEKEAP